MPLRDAEGNVVRWLGLVSDVIDISKIERGQLDVQGEAGRDSRFSFTLPPAPPATWPAGPVRP